MIREILRLLRDRRFVAELAFAVVAIFTGGLFLFVGLYLMWIAFT